MNPLFESIISNSWQATLLPQPKRYSRSKALGFCGDVPVGVAETAHGKEAACWWPGDVPELLVLEGFKDVRVLFARGMVIPGSWSKSGGGKIGAAAWQLTDGELKGRDLHDTRFERTWAEGTGGGLVLGTGVHKGKLGVRPNDSGLIWSDTGELREVTGDDDVCLRATDGIGFAGSVGGHATYWPAFGAPPVDLTPSGMPASEVHAIDGEMQIGYAFKKLAAHAVVWRGSSASALDLTPVGFEESRAFDGTCGYQVGCIRKNSSTPNGSSAYDDRAVIWQGTPDLWFDLNALLPEPFNASSAWAICFTADRIQVCGEARRVEVSDSGTPRESHYAPMAQAVLWTAQLKCRQS